MITILLVDDQYSARTGLKLRLSLEPDITVLGEAVDGDDAVEQATALEPDVVVMDVVMPNKDGIDATRELRDLVPDCAVVMLSLHDDHETRQRAEEAGAVAFVTKQEPDMTLLDAIRRANEQRSA